MLDDAIQTVSAAASKLMGDALDLQDRVSKIRPSFTRWSAVARELRDCETAGLALAQRATGVGWTWVRVCEQQFALPRSMAVAQQVHDSCQEARASQSAVRTRWGEQIAHVAIRLAYVSIVLTLLLGAASVVLGLLPMAAR